MLLGQEQNVNARLQAREKEISIRQIVEDERRIIEDRFKKDLMELKMNNQREVRQVQSQGTNIRMKNEKLQRVLIDKENDLLRHHEVVTNLEQQIAKFKEQAKLSQSKLIALESYTSDLQVKYERLVQSENEKSQALAELLNNDLTQKVVEYKNQVNELRESMKIKEKEKEIYIQHLNLNSGDP